MSRWGKYCATHSIHKFSKTHFEDQSIVSYYFSFPSRLFACCHHHYLFVFHCFWCLQQLPSSRIFGSFKHKNVCVVRLYTWPNFIIYFPALVTVCSTLKCKTLIEREQRKKEVAIVIFPSFLLELIELIFKQNISEYRDIFMFLFSFCCVYFQRYRECL